MRASLALSGRQEEEIDQPSQLVNIQPEPKPPPKPVESPIEIVAPPTPSGLTEQLIKGATELLRAPQKTKKGLIAAALIVFSGWAVVYGINLVVDGSKGRESPIQPVSGGAVASNYEAAFAENLNGVKLEMLRVPGGSFLMGSPDSEEGHNEDEGPQHQVTVPDFYIGKYEVTQTQWKAVMGANNNPSSFKGDDLPVEQVSWNDAKAFCEKLSRMTNRPYRLPSEAEWEYACRARTTGAYAGNLDAMAWYVDNADYKTHPVGQKQANAFGLYDMHGNVWEWCEDIYHESYGGKHGNPPADGSAWLVGGVPNFRSLRGGAWGNGSRIVRSATRSGSPVGERYFKFGFRVAVSTRTP
jgi:formylglycine-generating enzyme required for sulfatase activity